MASDQQVVLTKVHRGGSSHLNRTARQVVPAFLQKLYEMVSDASNSSLIRWSDTGDSFFVLDHERFAREVLGRWFKHQNFSSFVRQLNMYGFHKIPHLQQGVLKSETDTEYWNFEHPNFHRGQPDLLCLIQRKKQAAQSADDPMDMRDSTHTATPNPNATLSAGQLLDINSILNGIAAIKRHQSAISSDLNQLKQSNELLWQESLASREKHKKQQDTINRILKFLAGVFGNASSTVHKANPVDHASRTMMQRQPARLMIEQGPSHPGKGVSIVEVEDEDMSNLAPQSPLEEQSPMLLDQFTDPTPSPAHLPVTPSDAPMPNFTDTSSDQLAPLATPTPSLISKEGPSSFANVNSNADTPSLASHDRAPTPTSLTTTSGASNPDPMQAAIAEMLNSPGQMQRLLATLAAQPNFPLSDPMSPPDAEEQGTRSSSQLTAYDPIYDFTRAFQDDSNPAFGRFSSIDAIPPAKSPDTMMPPYDSLAQQGTGRLQKNYKDTQEIDKDVSALHSSINSLIESLGLDPNVINAPPTQDNTMPASEGAIDPESLTSMNAPNDDPIAADFDFNAFLNEFSGATDYGSQPDSSVFLDEVNSVSDAATPTSLPQDPPSIPTTTTTRPGRKRKSDAADLEREHTKSTTNPDTKVKRKR